jgi:ribosomal-protein-alanine N-acetyltransferase
MDLRTRQGGQRFGTPQASLRKPNVIIDGEMTVRKPAQFEFRPMRQGDAEDIASWQYPDEYSFYNWTSDPADLAELLDPEARANQYFAATDSSGSVVGFFQYKPSHEGRLEIGLGLHPAWTGRGFGLPFLKSGLDFARRCFAPQTFTLSVASFNRRAITVYERAGFTVARTYMHWTNGAEWEFTEMTRPA